MRATGATDVLELQGDTVVGQRLQATHVRRQRHRGHGSSSQSEQGGEEEEEREEDVRAQRRDCGREVSDVQEGLKGFELNDAEGQGQEHRFEFNADLQTVRVDRGGAEPCCEDEANGSNARRCVNDADRDERHVAVDATGNA